ncbi:ATP-binding cassette domain-containing protein [Bifidobacterium gallicum]|uniref:Ribose import ATP-binding protein RbsA 3 n=1 Tax=Bifidobacterium gallicum DSM 20093 = LMG 11596 TaxID=561180 RepID=D1NS83_9BIFI|nr:ATP-binding cassette domain-containing protein [Bifidobacterium gallicum]EFA23535.1 hypothetical protein BIFGAL_02639 [Bifidobacterium gallicum DSM 20093 = LMG 11596]KFI58610.1 ribose import ATP-binding protein RbsA 3 [Bifidobacterium gallicum DSM 20093 = LMG 11596]
MDTFVSSSAAPVIDSSDAAALLQVRGLTKWYDGFALSDVDLVVPPGMIVDLVGVNGSGKTTLMRCVLGCCRSS